MTHKLAEPYSGKNPVPQIATKVTSLLNPERATDAKAQQLQHQSGAKDQRQTEKRASKLAKGHAMRVTDPTTGEELNIRNADDELNTRKQGDNVLATPFPPPVWAEHRAHVISETYRSILILASAFVVCPLLTRLLLSSFYVFCFSFVPPLFLTYVFIYRLRMVSRGDFEDRVWHSERMRGLSAGSDVDGDGKVTYEERTQESAEWANAVLRGIWPVLNPDLFSSVVDMLEDIMQSSVPTVIRSVRIADLGLGRNAARITAIRSLPDAETRARNKSLCLTGNSSSLIPAAEGQHQDGKPTSNDPIADDEEALNGDHVNVEVCFAYRGLPSGKSAASKAGNTHLLVEFFLGIKGVYGVKIPVWVEITGAVGTARARLQLIPDPPFVKTTLVTLMGLPRVTISVTPLARFFPNVMDLPFVSGFVSGAIDTAVAEYVAPKSLTVDLQRLIRGDDIKKDTMALGVLVVHIHRATGVKGMDANGGSDPYVTLTYSRLGKPLYSTRIIKGNRNPVFEETAVLMVDLNTIHLREKLSFQLWDSDRTSVDDMLGVAEVNIMDLVRRRGVPSRRVSVLVGLNNKAKPGSVEYTVGYYGKIPPDESMRTDGVDPGIPSDLRDQPEFKEQTAVALNDFEAAVLVTPPDPQRPSGILSIQVHEIRDLSGAGKMPKGRDGEKGQDDDAEIDEEAEGLPSSYCEISLDDELVYKTRVKPITSWPMFNAGTERFVRDWRTSHVTIAVKDSRLRENDAILGVVMLKISELLVNASQLTRSYSIEEGLGYGRIRVSLLFRPVDAKLPPNLLGFDTGSLEIRDISVRVDDRDSSVDLMKCQLRIQTTKCDDTEKLSRKATRKRKDGSVVWVHETSGPNKEEDATATTIPVRQRYRSALLLSLKDSSASSGIRHSSGRYALAVLWLRDVVDIVQTSVQIALWQAEGGDYSRLKYNYVPPDGDLGYWDSDREKVKRLGTVAMDLKFKPGISMKHRRLMDGGGSAQKEAWDAFTRERTGGLRDAVGEMQVRQDEGESCSASPEAGVKTCSRRPTDLEVKVIDQLADQEGTITNSPINSMIDDGQAAMKDSSRHQTNTISSPEAVENVSSGGDSQPDDQTEDLHGQDGKKGVKQKLKDWKGHENELHQDHRGIMQFKSARTAEWIKDNVNDGARAVKEKFSMRSRKPDVETEV